nr:zinc finger, CCHC-type [Tanacetum cinerariifolium]
PKSSASSVDLVLKPLVDPAHKTRTKPWKIKLCLAGALLMVLHSTESLLTSGTTTDKIGTCGRYLATSLAVLPPRVSTKIRLARDVLAVQQRMMLSFQVGSWVQSVPSRTAFATSVASARVGLGDLIIDSSICVAVTTGFPFRARFAKNKSHNVERAETRETGEPGLVRWLLRSRGRIGVAGSLTVGFLQNLNYSYRYVDYKVKVSRFTSQDYLGNKVLEVFFLGGDKVLQDVSTSRFWFKEGYLVVKFDRFEQGFHQKGAQGNREAAVFYVSNDDDAMAQRRLKDKQLEEKTNTNCLVQEQEKVHLGIKVGASITVTRVPG